MARQEIADIIQGILDSERALFDAPAVEPADSAALSASATINAQIWFEQFPWRPTAAWVAAAGVLGLGLLAGGSLAAVDWRGLALLLLLVDPLWGSIWRMAAGRQEMLPLREQSVTRRFWLPYLSMNSPAAKIMGWDAFSTPNAVFPLLFRVAAPTVLLATAVAVVLDGAALWLTAVVIVCSMIGWVSRRTWRIHPHFLHAVVTIALPWALTLNVLQPELGSGESTYVWRIQLALLILWTIHNWGEGRCLLRVRDPFGIGLLAAADVGLGILLLVAKAPIWLALLSLLWLPTWICIYRGYSLRNVTFWWLLAMLVSAAAVGQLVYVQLI
ncbi:MAG: hypothetical protein R3A44_41010 [Caldilineaceae bacterium]